MDIRNDLYIGGAWVPASSRASIEVTDSRSGDCMGRVPSGDGTDVEAAVAAATGATAAWASSTPADRASALRKIADGLEQRTDELADTMSCEVGTPVTLSRRVQVGLAVAVFRSMAGIVEDTPLQSRVGHSVLLRQPAGVVAAITPWNYPLYQLAAKLAPALGAGCTVVVKPSGAAPLAPFVLAEIIDAIGLPPGTVNLVTGPGSIVGELLASHEHVDLVSITGSTAAGVRVAELASRTVKRVTLELGGKSAFVILDDADLDVALPVAIRSGFVNNGQTCSALSRVVVSRTRLAEVEDRLAALVAQMTVGDPLDPATDLGPLVSAKQQRVVRGYIDQGVAEGARLVVGGAEPPDGLEAGYYVRPTVLSDVERNMTVAREEIFGPVLVVQAADGDDDAVEIANDSEYGLSGGVWSADQDRALAVAARLRTGQVAVNGGRFNVAAPFGGFKRSGVGRELGEHGLAEYVEFTALHLPAPTNPS